MKTLNTKQKFKDTPAGRIPVDWECNRFKTYIKIKHGFAFKSKFFANSGEYIVLTPGNFFEGGGFKPRGTLDRFYLGEFPNEYILRKGDLIVAMTEQAEGLLGSPAWIEQSEKYLHNQRLGLVEVKDNRKSLKEFLYFTLSLPHTRRQISISAGGTKVKHTSPNKIGAVWVAFPPISEQKEIAKILSTWDQFIRLQEELIREKEERKRGLMQQLLTGKRRLPGFEGEWKEKRIADVFSERAETNRDELPLLSITAGRGVIPRDQVEKQDTSNSDKSRYKRISPGDIGYNTMRMWQGVSALSGLEGIISPAYTVVVPGPTLCAEFVKHYFKFPENVHLFFRYSQGLVNDTLNCKFKHFRLIRMRFPEKAEQEAIASILNQSDEEIAVEASKLNELKEQKRGLMQKLLTGQIRVRVGV